MSKRKSSNSRQTPDKRSRLSQPESSEEDETGFFSSGDGLSTSQSVRLVQHSTSVSTAHFYSIIPYV